ncbi:MAG: hypothetical protein KUG75_00310 [Pseudomonadales bacterium]|nr:hypothetical protein [Pseudomonadales bacterium]
MSAVQFHKPLVIKYVPCLLFACSILLAGCAGLNSQNMIPVSDAGLSAAATGQSINTYRLTNADGEVLWLKTYESEFSSHAFSGATRTVEAREGSVRENLASLSEGLKNYWKNK